MSDKIDNRVVEMQFNNKQFESGIKTSVKSLDNLKEGLKLDNAGKGLLNLQKISNSFSLEGIARGVQNLNDKFSALGIMGITVLQNLTNSALNAGKQLISSLTVDPVSEGYADYGRKLTSVQTIMNATGESIGTVSSYFKQLDTYADKTIYNLDDMTSAFAKFTNAGIKMEDSIPAIKGTANMVALAGQDAGAASIAMYNLSQSMSNGFLTTTDYRSLNLANVATKEWKDYMIATAVAMGTLKKTSEGLYLIPGSKEAITNEALFNEELSKGWASREVMIKVLGDYGDETTAIGKKALAAAQDVKSFSMMMETLKASVGTGWTDTFEILVGNLEEAKALFSPLTNALSEVIGKSADSRNEILAFWKANEGRTALLQGISNVLLGLASVMEPVEKAFSQIFPPMTGEKLVELTKGFRDLSTNFKIGAETADNLKRTFAGFFALLDIGGKIISFVAKCLVAVVKTLFPVGDGVLSITGNIGDLLVALDNAITKNNIFGVALEKFCLILGIVKSGISNTITAISALVEFFKKAISESTVFSEAIEKIKNVFSKVFTTIKNIVNDFTGSGLSVAASQTDILGTAFNRLYTIVSKTKEIITNVVTTIKNVLSPVITYVTSKIKELTMQDVGSILAGGGLLLFAKALLNGLSAIDNITKNFSKILEEVGNTLKAFQLKVKADALFKVAISIAVLTASLIALSFIKGGDLAKSLGILTVVFAELVVSLMVLDKVLKNQSRMSAQLVALGVSMLLLANAVRILSSIDSDKLLRGSIAMAGIMGVIAAFIKITKGGDLAASAGGLIGFSVGITILSGALAILGNLNLDKLIQGVSAIGALMTLIALFINLTKNGDLIASAGGLVGFSVGITILTGALAILGNINTSKLIQGVSAISALMTIIALFINLTKGGDLITSAGGLMGFATGITILTAALALLGGMDIGRLIQGTTAITTLLYVLGSFVNFTRGGDLAASAGGIIGFATGLIMLTGAVNILASMDTGKVIQGVSAITALMASIGFFVSITKGGDLALSAGGLIGFSVGITVLSGAIMLLASIDSGKILQGVSAIAALMATLGLFVNLTKEQDLTISATSLIGFAAGLAILAGVIAILSALDTGKLVMASGAIAMLMTTIAIFINFTKGGDLAISAASLVGFGIAIGVLAASLAVLSQLDTGKLLVAGAALSVIILSLTAFVKFTSGGNILLSVAGLILFSGAINLLSEGLAKLGSIDTMTLVKAVGALVGVFAVLGLSSAILAPLTPIILALSAAIAILSLGALASGTGIKAFAEGMKIIASEGKPFISVMGEMINLIPMLAKKLVEGIVEMAKSIKKGMPDIMDAIKSLAKGLIQTFEEITPPIVEAALQFIVEILDKFNKYSPQIIELGLSILTNLLKGIRDHMEEITGIAIDIILDFLNAFQNRLPDIIKTGVDIVAAILEGIGNESPRLINAGFQMMIDFINGLSDTLRNRTPELMDSFSNLGGAVIEGLTNGIVSTVKNPVKAMSDVATSLIDKTKEVLDIHSPSEIFKAIGTHITGGLGIGIDNGSSKAVEASANMSKNVVSASSNVVKDSNEAAKKAFDKSVEWIDERKYYNQLSLAEELAAWQEIQAQYLEGTEERKKADREVYRIQNEMRKADFDNSVKWIDEKKYYNQLSLAEELAAWERVQKRYLEGTEERKKADREVYSLNQEINKANEDLAKGELKIKQALTDKSKQLLDDFTKKSLEVQTEAKNKRKEIEDDYNTKVLETQKNADEERKKEYADYYQKTLDIQKTSNEKRKQLDEDYYANTANINDKLKQDIINVTKTYTDAVDSRSKSLYSSYGIFEKIEVKDPVNGDDLIKNLQDQVSEFDSWQKNISELTKKGIDEGLLKELQDMGPKAGNEITALNQLSKDKLDTYVSLWKTKHEEAKTQAISELEGMRIETLSKIDTLNLEASVKLDLYRQTWSTQVAALTNDTSKQLSELAMNWNNKLISINSDTDKKLSELKSDWSKKLSDINTDSAKQLEELKSDWDTKLTALNVDTAQQLSDLQNTWSDKLRVLRASTQSEFEILHGNVLLEVGGLRTNTEGEFKTLNKNVTSEVSDMRTTTEKEVKSLAENIQTTLMAPDWEGTGAYVVYGFINGMRSKISEAASMAASLARAALDAANQVLGINSPSKEFAKIGMYADQGLANGLNNFSGIVANSADNVGGVAMSALQSAISNISDIVSGNIDTAPVIRPVLDLSNVVDGNKQINTLFSQRQGINVSSIASKLPNIDHSNQNGSVSTVQTATPTQANVSFVQNNYSPKELSRLDIYRQTKNQISVLKGLVNPI